MDNRILIGIPTIDRDSDYIDELYRSIISELQNSTIINYEILVITRKTDLKVIEKWSKYSDVNIVQIAHYDIKTRHNIHMIACKRNIIRYYAIIGNYDYLWFVDSDVKLEKNYLKILMNGIATTNSYMCAIPYNVKWLNFPAIGLAQRNREKIEITILNLKNIDKTNNYMQCHVVGFGMTLLHSSIFKIPICVLKKLINGVLYEGEDFGFCLELFGRGLKISFSTQVIAHHY